MRSRFAALVRRAVTWRLGRAGGALLFVVGLARHVSEGSRDVLGRWSTTYAGVLLFCSLIVGVLVARAAARARGTVDFTNPVARMPITWVELAALLLGASYCAGAVLDPATASRALDLNILGSVTAAGAVGEWLALSCLFVSGLCLMGRLPSRAMNVALLAATVAATGLGAEGWVRGAAIVHPQIEGFPTNRHLMWYRRFGTLNAFGFRDVEHDAEAPDGVRRLLVFGDSFAFGSGIDNRLDRFGERLADALGQGTGERWEAVNAGLSDTHTRQHAAFLEYGLRFRPALVVLLYVFNDIEYLRPMISRTALTEHPKGVVDRLHPLRLLFKNSFAFQELYVRWRLFRYRTGADTDPLGERYNDTALVRQHLADLSTLIERARAAGAVAAIVPFDIEVAGRERARQRYRTFVDASLKAGLPVWSAEAAFGDTPLDQLVANPLDGHPNARANALLVGSVLARALDAVRREAADSGSRVEHP